MPTAIRVTPIDHREGQHAAALHAVMGLAYAHEARLLHGDAHPPFVLSIDDIAASAAFHLAALRDGRVVGVLCIGRDEDPQRLCISTLVVHPEMHRQGIARLLVQDALARGRGMAFAVSVAAGNAPALGLYESLGFVVSRRGVIGAGELPLLRLTRAAKPP
jgi:ribosomal protein S18 acetylase RimI-like enzyme